MQDYPSLYIDQWHIAGCNVNVDSGNNSEDEDQITKIKGQHSKTVTPAGQQKLARTTKPVGTGLADISIGIEGKSMSVQEQQQ